MGLPEEHSAVFSFQKKKGSRDHLNSGNVLVVVTVSSLIESINIV